MREYRGKRVDNGEWVSGYYFITPLTDEATNSKPEDGWYFLTGRQRHCISRNNCVYEVVPKTVGQYAGLKDKNGKEIFKDDIVKITEYKEGIYTVIWDDFRVAWWLKNIKTDNRELSYEDDYCQLLGDCWQIEHREVIGNLHDNPELLEVR